MIRAEICLRTKKASDAKKKSLSLSCTGLTQP